MNATEATWPYSTHDEVSHLACEDVPVLRARIDQLLEERRELRSAAHMDVCFPDEWRLTPGEERVLAELVRTPEGKVATKDRLHSASAFSTEEEPETAIKIVDVIVCKLRKKLAAVGVEPIETVWGRGYRASGDFRRRFGGQAS